MKKIWSIIAAGTLALLALSCAKEEKAVFDATKATPPVLREVLMDDNNNIVVQYTPAVFKMDFNQQMKTYHTLALLSIDGKEANHTLTTKNEDNTITLTGKTLTNALRGHGYNMGDVVTVVMVVRGSIQDPSRGITNGYVDSKEKYELNWTLADNSGNTDPYAGWEKSTWGVTGSIASAGIAWDTDIEMFTDGTWHVAKSVVLSASDQFKFRKDGGWDVNFGAGPDITEEPYVVTLNTELPAGAGGKNLAVASDGTYDLLINPDAEVYKVIASAGGGGSELPDIDLSAYDYLAVMEGAETWGVIGPAVSDWSTDVDLEKISDDPEIWCAKGMPFQEDSFKFRGNDTWADYDLGGGVFAIEEPIVMTKGGGDMTAQAGNYDVYLYPTYGVAYLKPAGGDTPPPPEKPKAWSLIGTFEDSGWGTDYDLENVSGNTWVIKNMFMREGEQFKIRADHAWNKSFGGPEANLEIPDGEGTKGVYQPVIGETFTAGGVDIYIPAEGYYNVTLNYGNNESTILIEEYKEFPDHVYMIGADFGAWDWNSDGIVELVPVVHQPSWGANAEAQFWTVKYLKAGSDHGFKFCSQKAWSGDFWGLDENDGFVEEGGNCTVAEDGNYLIHIDFKRSMVHIEPARIYGIGACWGNKWEENLEEALFQPDGEKLKITIPAEGELRMYVASEIATSDWWTREFIFFEDGVIDYRGDDEGQGDQGRVNVLKDQVVVLDFNAGTGAIEGEGQQPEPPAAAYMIGGQFGNWDWNSDGVVELIPVWNTDNLFWCTRWFDASQGFKFNSKKAWGGDFTGEGGPLYTVGEDTNCHVPANGLYTVLVNVADKTVEITEAEVYGLGDAVFTGGWDFDSAQKFEVEGDKFVLTTSGAGELRLSSKVMPSAPIDGVTTGGGWIDWWKTEFIFFEDCKIDYRGKGPDQARRQVEAGKKIVIDFNAGTAYFEGEVPPPPANGITIDGDMSDWAGIEGATGEGINAAFKVASDENNIYFYVKRTTERIGDIWGGACYHYYCFDMDNDPSTGVELWGNGPYELLLVVYPYGGSAEAPEFGIAKAGATMPEDFTVDNAVIKGVVTESGVETEIAISRADLMSIPGTAVTVYSWSNKGGSDKLSVTCTL